jgi:hypothetical protein
MTKYIPIRQQIWQAPVFSTEEGEEFAPTRHQVDCWKAEASNFAATLDELPYGRRDWWDVLATRAYQAGRDSVETKSVTELSPVAQPNPVAPTDEELDEFAVFWWGSDTDERTVTDVIECCSMTAYARAVLARWGQP